MTKFLFDQSFDQRGGESASRARPTFTEADLAAAEVRGFAAGEDAGLAQARGEIEMAAAAALQQIAGQITAYGQTHVAALNERRGETAVLAFRIASKLASTLMQRHPLVEVETLVAQCLSDLVDEPRIVVRTGEPVAEALERRLGGLVAATGFPGKIVLLPDERLTGSDCRVEWADGGAERNTPALTAQIEAAVTRFLDVCTGSDVEPENRPTGDM